MNVIWYVLWSFQHFMTLMMYLKRYHTHLMSPVSANRLDMKDPFRSKVCI
jgi:hypothetical protein